MRVENPIKTFISPARLTGFKPPVNNLRNIYANLFFLSKVQVLELACALGVSSEFPNSHQLWQRWTQIELTEKTLANQVEKTGNQLQKQEFDSAQEPGKEAQFEPPKISETKPDLLYVGVDGVMTPLNQKQGYKEAKVGVIFWGKDHQKIPMANCYQKLPSIETKKKRFN